ncbi:MAG TPA: IS5 family transposase [Firmicutes bacterium]|nr:IS5 family transposase [Bacillota bacterium]
MNQSIYKTQGKRGLFDNQLTRTRLSEIGNPLEKLLEVTDFEMFRPLLEERLLNTNKKSSAGAKPYDFVMMFKILILQRYYGLGDKQTEYQIIDRTSFKVFLGLDTGDKVPDEKTVWAFRERVTETGLIEELFTLFNTRLEENHMIFNEGQLVDASFVIAPRQRNTRKENKAIKDGNGSDLWNDEPKKKKHKDIDARWTKKNNEVFYGFKDHAKVDKVSKIIVKYAVTDASVHDSQALASLLSETDKGQNLYADSAYTGEVQEQTIDEYGMINQVTEKGYRNTPLTEEQKGNNRVKSKIRARVEHVFGFLEQSMNGLFVRCVGIKRASGVIGLMNLTYNLFRAEQLQRTNCG